VNIPERTHGFFMRDKAVNADIGQKMLVERIELRPLMMGRESLNEPRHRVKTRVTVMGNVVFRAYRLHHTLLASLA
jgi:hypothetical protein